MPAAIAADGALNELEDWLAADAPPEWSGPAWEALQRLPRLLLEYMRGRPQADVTALENALWGKDVSEAALHGALNKANEFLAKVRHHRTLAKVRGEPVARWQ